MRNIYFNISHSPDSTRPLQTFVRMHIRNSKQTNFIFCCAQEKHEKKQKQKTNKHSTICYIIIYIDILLSAHFEYGNCFFFFCCLCMNAKNVGAHLSHIFNFLNWKFLISFADLNPFSINIWMNYISYFLDHFDGTHSGINWHKSHTHTHTHALVANTQSNQYASINSNRK